MSAPPPPPVRSRSKHAHPALRSLVPLLILLTGGIVTVILVRTPRVPVRRPAGERGAWVEIQPLKSGSTAIHIETAGTVIPREAVPLQARVSGEIVAIHPRFAPGGRFAAGEVIVEIDPSDYSLDATNMLASLQRAEAGLDLERGLQDVARHEWDIMRRMDPDMEFSDQDQDLALRRPQLRLAESDVMAARAAHDRALLNLDRTRVRAPFNAVIRERHVSVGTQVGPQTVLAQIAGTDAYWVSVTLPVEQVKWIDPAVRDGNSKAVRARVISAAGARKDAAWEGRVIQRLPDLEPRGRQTQLLVEVGSPDAPAEGEGELPIGMYARVIIDGPTLDHVFTLPLSALREGRWVWLMNGDDRLDIREVTVVWSDRERVVIRDGLFDGERLVITDIPIPIQGMPLWVDETNGDAPVNAGSRDE